MQRYDIYIASFLDSGSEPAHAVLARLFAIEAGLAQRIVASVPRVVKREVPGTELERYASALSQAGAQFELRPSPIRPQPTLSVAGQQPQPRERDGQAPTLPLPPLSPQESGPALAPTPVTQQGVAVPQSEPGALALQSAATIADACWAASPNPEPGDRWPELTLAAASAGAPVGGPVSGPEFEVETPPSRWAASLPQSAAGTLGPGLREFDPAQIGGLAGPETSLELDVGPASGRAPAAPPTAPGPGAVAAAAPSASPVRPAPATRREGASPPTAAEPELPPPRRDPVAPVGVGTVAGRELAAPGGWGGVLKLSLLPLLGLAILLSLILWRSSCGKSLRGAAGEVAGKATGGLLGQSQPTAAAGVGSGQALEAARRRPQAGPWLESDLHQVAGGDKDRVRGLVRSLKQAGAVEVYAGAIDRSPPLKILAEVVVELPGDSEERKAVFAIYENYLRGDFGDFVAAPQDDGRALLRIAL
ncbi:MAG: hypothetical protein OEZ06_06615 [Myxococcales bacterium]|nr:hypothetical protein [Myxococcales bacterium]